MPQDRQLSSLWDGLYRKNAPLYALMPLGGVGWGALLEYSSFYSCVVSNLAFGSEARVCFDTNLTAFHKELMFFLC